VVYFFQAFPSNPCVNHSILFGCFDLS
jgi:hypothetical protein